VTGPRIGDAVLTPAGDDGVIVAVFDRPSDPGMVEVQIGDVSEWWAGADLYVEPSEVTP
jgi:hypothetical protein